MTDIWIKPDQVFDGQSLSRSVALRIKDGRVDGLSSSPPTDAQPVSGCLTPGFLDLQVNGGGNVQLNSTPTRAGMSAIVAAHRRFGTVGLLPTVITDKPEVLDQAVQAALEAKGDPGVLGLHIEGPHITLEKRGTHSGDYVRPLDDVTLNHVERLRAADIPVLITLAPEAATLAQISALAQMGALVSLGHTNATADGAEAALKAGARCGTHLFNAMSPMLGRAPGVVGTILGSDAVFGIICDGYHVDDRMIDLALRIEADRGRAFLVSDAMATVGGDDHFILYGEPVKLVDGRLVNQEGNLAGAHFTQAQGVARLVQNLGQPLDRALRMAVTVPAQAIGRADLAQLQGRELSDLILLDDDLQVSDLSDHLDA